MLDKKQLSVFTLKNILPLAQAGKVAQKLRSQGKKIGLCHGTFDLLHPGHIKHFESASRLCDALFVTVTSDRFASQRKGPNRPIYNEILRAFSIASIRYVHCAAISDSKTAAEAISAIKPDLYIKGPDYTEKNSPGILAERKAVEMSGGKIAFTSDPKLSTSQIMLRIKGAPDSKKLFICVDRDGTLIEKVHYLGKDADWKRQVKLVLPVARLIRKLQSACPAFTVVVSNQAGVALKLFPEERVPEINGFVQELLLREGASIDRWEYCPDVDEAYARESGIGRFDPARVKKETCRKPSVRMVLGALEKSGMRLCEFEKIIVIGDSEDDRLLAENLQGEFIDAKKVPLSENQMQGLLSSLKLPKA